MPRFLTPQYPVSTSTDLNASGYACCRPYSRFAFLTIAFLAGSKTLSIVSVWAYPDEFKFFIVIDVIFPAEVTTAENVIVVLDQISQEFGYFSCHR
jgi:hypothetical protein